MLFGCPEGFAQKSRIAGISPVEGTAVDDEIVKGFQLGVTESSGGFGQIPRQGFQKMEDLIGTYFIHLSSGIKGTELVKQKPVALNSPLLVVGLKMALEQADSFSYNHSTPPYSS